MQRGRPLAVEYRVASAALPTERGLFVHRFGSGMRRQMSHESDIVDDGVPEREELAREKKIVRALDVDPSGLQVRKGEGCHGVNP